VMPAGGGTPSIAATGVVEPEIAPGREQERSRPPSPAR
jgi:hypothetical protein